MEISRFSCGVVNKSEGHRELPHCRSESTGQLDRAFYDCVSARSASTTGLLDRSRARASRSLVLPQRRRLLLCRGRWRQVQAWRRCSRMRRPPLGAGARSSAVGRSGRGLGACGSEDLPERRPWPCGLEGPSPSPRSAASGHQEVSFPSSVRRAAKKKSGNGRVDARVVMSGLLSFVRF